MKALRQITLLALLAAPLLSQSKPVLEFFRASGTEVEAGDSAVLSWSVQNTGEVILDPGGLRLGAKGELRLRIPRTTVFTLFAVTKDAAGSEVRTSLGMIRILARNTLQDMKPGIPRVEASAPPPQPPPPMPEPPRSERARASAPRDRGPRLSAHAFLLRGATPAPGFGVYSYFLLGAVPGPAERPAVIQCIQAFLARIRSASGLIAAGADPANMNALHLPVKKLVEASGADRAAAEAILSEYDFDRAQLLLASVNRADLRGPVLVTAPVPLPENRIAPRPYLVQDIGVVVEFPDFASAWVEQFVRTAAEEEPWNAQRLEQTVLRMQAWLERTGAQLPRVRKSLVAAIALLKPAP